MMARVAQLGYIGLGVSNVDEWEQFATGVLGLQAHARDPDGSLLLRMDDYHHRFIVSPGDADDLTLVGWESGGRGNAHSDGRSAQRQ